MNNQTPQHGDGIMTGQQEAAGYLRMQKIMGSVYLGAFFRLLDQQNKTGRFLEIGSGPGYQTAKIAAKYPGVKIVAVEPSADMNFVATRYLIRQGMLGRVQLVKGVVEDEELIQSLGQFDLIYSTFSLHHWADPLRALRNLYAALKPDGVLLIHDFEQNWLTSRFSAHRGRMNLKNSAYTAQEIQAMLAQAAIPPADIRPNFPFLSIRVTRPANPTSVQTQNPIKPLDQLKEGQSGLIHSIKMRTPERLRELATMGISPETVVRMITNYGHHITFKIDRKVFAADKEFASGIAIQVFR